MTLAELTANAIVVFIGTAGLVGCGGADGDSMRATLTDDKCTYQGSSTPESGVFTVAVDNQTDRFANFVLGEHLGGAESGAIARVLSVSLPAEPAPDVVYMRPVSAAEVEPHAASELPANQEPAGKYVVACIMYAGVGGAEASIERAYIAALLRVGDR